jgi:hypothetical protein
MQWVVSGFSVFETRLVVCRPRKISGKFSYYEYSLWFSISVAVVGFYTLKIAHGAGFFSLNICARLVVFQTLTAGGCFLSLSQLVVCQTLKIAAGAWVF